MGYFLKILWKLFFCTFIGKYHEHEMPAGLEKTGSVLTSLYSKKVARTLCKWSVKFWHAFPHVRYTFPENVLRKKWTKKSIVDLL